MNHIQTYITTIALFTTDYHILDTTGRLIYSGNAATLQLSRGVYIVTLVGKMQKIIL